jgi:uncharacterized RDD family membrane protein YckC
MEQPHTETTDLFKDAPVIYGGFWERFGAAFLDGLILLVPSLILQYTVSRELYLVLAILINWLYYASQESGAAQATFGKKALGLKVTTLSGGRISFGQATGRYFGKLISGLILLIGYLMMLWDNKKQTLHDKMAGTLVVKK